MAEKKQIRVEEPQAERIAEMKRYGETYADVVGRLLDAYDEQAEPEAQPAD